MAVGEAKKKKGRWKRWARDLLVFALIFGAISLWQGRHLLDAGEAAPDIELVDLEGNPVQLAELQGKKVLLYFWAPWCGVCKAVTPNLRWLAGTSGVEVVSVASGYEDVDSVLAAAPVDFSNRALLGDRDATQAFAVRAYPTFYVLDDEGRIKRSFLGYTSRFGLWWRTRL